MRLAEALAERKDVIARIAEYPNKLAEAATWEEDERKPDESVLKDLNESLDQDLNSLQGLNVAIHEANNLFTVKTENGSMTLMEAIALRDRLNLERITASRAKDAVESAMGRSGRYLYGRRSKEDVKISTLVAPRDLGREEDALAGEIRRLDMAIQMVNWSQDLP